MTTWDKQTGARALGIAGLAMLVAWLLTAATDEGGVAWGERLARVLPLSPACAGVGTWLALARGRARGEARALETLGRSPWQRAWAAVIGGAAPAVVAGLAVGLVASVDLRAFYPALQRGSPFQLEDGLFVDRARGIAVAADGSLVPIPNPEQPDGASGSVMANSPRLPAGGRPAAAVALVLAGVALPLVAARARRESMLLGGLAVAGMAVASIVLFQAAGARRMPAVAAALPSMLLLGAAAWRYRADSWRTIRR